MHNFKELAIWQKGMNVAMECYKITNQFPKDEQFNLTNQLRRAAVSVPSNISEGSSRKSDKDFNRFLHISLGSLFELETQLILSEKLGYIKGPTFNKMENQISELQRMIYGFSNKISDNYSKS